MGREEEGTSKRHRVWRTIDYRNYRFNMLRIITRQLSHQSNRRYANNEIEPSQWRHYSITLGNLSRYDKCNRELSKGGVAHISSTHGESY